MTVERDPAKSPLPTDPKYWDDLAERIAEDARAPLAQYAKRRDVWYGVLSREAPWLVAASAAALLLLWLALPEAPRAHSSFIERAVAPREAAGSLLGGSEPPSVDELMLAFPPVPESEVTP